MTWTCIFFLPDRPTPTFPDKKKSKRLDNFFYFKFPTDRLGKIGSSLIRHSRNQPTVALIKLLVFKENHFYPISRCYFVAGKSWSTYTPFNLHSFTLQDKQYRMPVIGCGLGEQHWNVTASTQDVLRLSCQRLISMEIKMWYVYNWCYHDNDNV